MKSVVRQVVREPEAQEFLLWHSRLRNPCGLCGGEDSIPGPVLWVKDQALLQLWHRSKLCLDSVPGLGTSICCRCSWKRKTKNKQTKKTTKNQTWSPVMQIQTTWGCFIPSRLARFQKTAGVGLDTEKWEPSSTAGGDGRGAATLENNLGNSSRGKCTITVWPSYSTPKHLPNINQNICPHKDAYSSFPHPYDSQKVKTRQIFVTW